MEQDFIDSTEDEEQYRLRFKMLQPQFEEAFKKWLMSAMFTLDTPSGRSIYQLLCANLHKLGHNFRGDEDEAFATSVLQRLQELSPLLSDVQFRREMRVGPWQLPHTLNRVSPVLQENLNLLWEEIRRVTYERRWASAQWVPTLLMDREIDNQQMQKRPHQVEIESAAEPVVSDRSPSRILGLPGEIRNLIWRYVLVEDLPPGLQTAGFRPAIIANGHTLFIDYTLKPKLTPTKPPPAICAANRQIRTETLPIHYGENIFALTFESRDSYTAAVRWLSSLADSHIACLQGVVLHGRALQDRSPFTFGIRSAQSIRVFVEFRSLTVRKEDTANVDQRAELFVIQQTLADIRQDLDDNSTITRKHIRLLVGNFARFCATLSDGHDVPLLATGSHWDKLAARSAQAAFLSSFGRGKGEQTEETQEEDVQPTRFAIW